MKKSILFLVGIVTIINMVLPVSAQEKVQKVGAGYTSDGIYYEVYMTEALENADRLLYGTSMSVTREVVYSGIIAPQREISWREKINGIYYSGVLTLNKFSYNSTQTIAEYTGILCEE